MLAPDEFLSQNDRSRFKVKRLPVLTFTALTWPGELTLSQLAVVTCSVRLPEGEELKIFPVTCGFAAHEALADTGFATETTPPKRTVQRKRTVECRGLNNLATFFMRSDY